MMVIHPYRTEFKPSDGNATTPCLDAKAILLAAVMLAMTNAANADRRPEPHRVKGDLVVQSKTAIAIATAIASETYGVDQIRDQSPLIATRTGTTWHVAGQLPPDTPGGVVELWISVEDGRVLRMTHGR